MDYCGAAGHGSYLLEDYKLQAVLCSLGVLPNLVIQTSRIKKSQIKVFTPQDRSMFGLFFYVAFGGLHSSCPSFKFYFVDSVFDKKPFPCEQQDICNCFKDNQLKA